MVSLEEGGIAVRMARKVLEKALDGPYGGALMQALDEKDLPAVFSERRGLFVTLETYPGKELRGCIGFPRAVYPLHEAILRGAWLAAREDPRFEPVSKREVMSILIEVSILTPMERVDVDAPMDLIDEIKVGRDGLYVVYGDYSGLLLPQVPVDEGWNSERFLEGICMKAGLEPESWKEKGPTFFTFRSEIFAEERPGGKVVLRDLKPGV